MQNNNVSPGKLYEVQIDDTEDGRWIKGDVFRALRIDGNYWSAERLRDGWVSARNLASSRYYKDVTPPYKCEAWCTPGQPCWGGTELDEKKDCCPAWHEPLLLRTTGVPERMWDHRRPTDIPEAVEHEREGSWTGLGGMAAPFVFKRPRDGR